MKSVEFIKSVTMIGQSLIKRSRNLEAQSLPGFDFVSTDFVKQNAAR